MSSRNFGKAPGVRKPSSSTTTRPDLHVRVSQRFVVLTLLACTLAAFAVGRTARMLLLVRPGLAFLQEQHATSLITADQLGQLPRSDVMKLPNPSLKNGKVPPSTLYTSKNFDTALSATIHSRWVVSEGGGPPALPSEACSTTDDSTDCATCSRGAAVPVVTDDVSHDTEGEIHLPAGQHLLMDIQKVDYDFLASEERLATAMLDVVGECGLTLLSYHCHGLYPAGVSCVGVLLESHVSFHTWPAEGVITLDLFTCGANSLLPIVPTVERLFSVPRAGVTDLMDMPETIWAYKLRGFGEDTEESKAALTDLFTFPIGAMTEYKKEIASFSLSRVRIDIYDVLRSPYQTLTSYKRLLTDPTSYEAQHPAVFEPDRIVFYNGVLQTRRSSTSVLYEMYVHPVMLAHPNPKRVAVLGFEDGAIIRELLKHKSVEEVVLLEYDEVLLNMTMEHFPEYYNCTFLGNQESNCMDDPRISKQRVDIWDVSKEGKEAVEASYDVIIVDEQDFVESLGETLETLKWLHDALSETGILVASMGFASQGNSPAVKVGMAQGFLDSLLQVGFAAVRDYEEGNLGFEIPWRFAVAFNSLESRASWFTNEAMMSLNIRKRITPLYGGDTAPLSFFDSAAPSSIMFPSRLSAEEFCHHNHHDPAKSCSRQGFDRHPVTEEPIQLLRPSRGEGTRKLDFYSIQKNS